MRCTVAAHSKCAPWPERVIYPISQPGRAVCWRHPTDWRLEKKVNLFFPSPELFFFFSFLDILESILLRTVAGVYCLFKSTHPILHILSMNQLHQPKFQLHSKQLTCICSSLFIVSAHFIEKCKTYLGSSFVDLTVFCYHPSDAFYDLCHPHRAVSTILSVAFSFFPPLKTTVGILLFYLEQLLNFIKTIFKD